jgi:ketosteroid isomerase-like protein
MTPETVQKVITAYFANLRAMDVEAWVTTFADDAVSHDPLGAPPLKGRTALREFAANTWSLWESIDLQEQQIFVATNEAAVKWTGYGRTKGGREVRFEGVNVMIVNDQGKIQTLRAYWDAASVARQMGAVSELPASKS